MPDTSFALEDSIYKSIAKNIGIHEDDTSFNTMLVHCINTVFTFLYRIGIGPDTPFSISSDAEVWSDFINNIADFNPSTTYMYAKVKLMFDPPANASLIKVLEDVAAETEWTLYILGDERRINREQ